ncbi:hypothetical protein [Actinoplanes sp. NPDC051411]
MRKRIDLVQYALTARILFVAGVPALISPIRDQCSVDDRQLPQIKIVM